MSCSVNMVPEASLRAQARAKRLVRWLAVCTSAALLLAAGWIVQYMAAAGLARFGGKLANLDQQRTKADAHLVSARKRRAELAHELRMVAATKRPQPWPRRLAQLTGVAPDGVLITAINITPPERPAEPKQTTTSRERRREKDEAPPAPAPEPSYPDDTRQRVRIQGQALDHATLIQLLNGIEQLPEWHNVELIQATQQPCGAALVIAFELDCYCGPSAPAVASGVWEGTP